MRHRLILTSGLLLILALAASLDAADRKQPKATDTAKIRKWVEQLDSDRFAERRKASQLLSQLGSRSIPFLEPASHSKSVERSARAIRILQKLAESDDESTEDAAVAALQRVIIKAERRVALRASNALAEQQKFQRQRSIASVRRLGGTVYINSKVQTPSIIVRIQDSWDGGNRGLRLLKRLGGVTWLSLERSIISEEGLRYVGELSQLKKLYLGQTQLRTGKGLVHLHGLKQLSYLSMRQLPIGNDALKLIGELKQLDSLGLDDTKITDSGIKHLAQLKKLSVLWLNRTRITHRGVADLAELPRLRRLYLAGTRATGPGLATLKNCEYLSYLSLKNVKFAQGDLKFVGQITQLDTLGLDHTNVSDEQLIHLSGMKKLRVLWLSKTRVSDKGLLHLRALTGLKQVYLHGAQVTKDGVAQLRKDLKDCRVHY